MFKSEVFSGNYKNVRADLLLVPCFKTELVNGVVQSVDTFVHGKIQKALTQKRFSAKEEAVLIIDAPEAAGVEHIAVVGLGEEKHFNPDKIRLAAYTGIKSALKMKVESCAVIIPTVKGISKERSVTAYLEGVFLAEYEFMGLHKKDPKKDAEKKKLKTLTLIDSDNEPGLYKKVFAQMEIIFEAVNKAKDLVNLPSNVVTPRYLENVAKNIVKNNPKIKLTVLSYAEALRLGMGAFCAVAKGSDEPARFIALEYKGGGKDLYAIVGKGLTFDSGGISLKPSGKMGEMKTDMSGAATVLGAFEALTKMKVQKNILCIVPATENMPGGKSYKPGDVITTANGKTVEINSTDAEGRMLLADALWYAQQQGAKKIIDYATLTGACTVALGQTRAGVMTNDQKYLDQYLKASELSGEKHWQLPMDEEYSSGLKSTVADTVNNSEDRLAGTISAAKFLEKFIDDGVSWIHCDIAGTAYLSKKQRYLDKEATGFGIRTLVEWLS